MYDLEKSFENDCFMQIIFMIFKQKTFKIRYNIRIKKEVIYEKTTDSGVNFPRNAKVKNLFQKYVI